jgi:hypothetical protein
MRSLLCGVAAMCASLFVFSAPAAAESVNCPLTTAQRDVTTPVPSGWYTTPVRSRLTETRVFNMGSQPTMLCQYGEAASVMREVPAGQTCVARSGGFECAAAGGPAPAPVSETHAAGTFTVRGTYNIDFDAGAEAPAAAADFWYEVIRDNETYFTPRNGARIAVLRTTEPGYSGCTAATYTTARTRIESTTGGHWFCVRTSEGRIAQFRIDGVDRFSRPRTMTITFATWR